MLKDLCKVFGVRHLDMPRKKRSFCHADLVFLLRCSKQCDNLNFELDHRIASDSIFLYCQIYVNVSVAPPTSSTMQSASIWTYSALAEQCPECFG